MMVTCLVSLNLSYPKSEDSLESVPVSASVYIYNAQTKGTQHKSLVKPTLKGVDSTLRDTFMIWSLFGIWLVQVNS